MRIQRWKRLKMTRRMRSGKTKRRLQIMRLRMHRVRRLNKPKWLQRRKRIGRRRRKLKWVKRCVTKEEEGFR